ncbi:MAG: hypothetical protein AAF678_01840 [Pseudomonadota bacterium]
MKRITLLTLVAFCSAAVAANIPRSLIHGKTPEERRSEVFSAFVALGDTRGAEVVPFLSDLAGITGETRRMQNARLARVAPQVLDLIAEEMDLGPDAYRQALREGSVYDPFDHSGSVIITTPDFDHHGRDNAWSWGVWAPSEDTADPGPETGALGACDIWLVIWNETQWLYAPMGTEVLNKIALAATPELMGVPFARLPTCDPDA